MKRLGWLTTLQFCAPAGVLYVGLVLFPTFLGFCYSLTDWSGWTATPRFVGLTHFRNLPGDRVFLSALRFTLFETILVVFFFTVVALVLAVLLNNVRRWKGLIRGMFFYPFTLSLLVSALLFQYLANYREGAVNVLLRASGLEGLVRDWMGSPDLVPYFILALLVWCGLGFFTTIYLAGLQSIPQELYEAAVVDGSGPIRTFLHVQVPMLVPVIKTNSVLALLLGMNLFPQILVTTQGGPGYRTFTIGYYIYWLGSLQDRQGYASAVSLVLFIILVVVSIVQVRVFQRKEVAL